MATNPGAGNMDVDPSSKPAGPPAPAGGGSTGTPGATDTTPKTTTDTAPKGATDTAPKGASDTAPPPTKPTGTDPSKDAAKPADPSKGDTAAPPKTDDTGKGKAPAVDKSLQPFTKLHMIQADYGDSLLLEYRDIANQPPRFWLTDGGPLGRRYDSKMPRAAQHLFTTLNTIPVTGSNNIGVPSLERLIMTHPHEDHITGIDFLLVSLG